MYLSVCLPLTHCRSTSVFRQCSSVDAYHGTHYDVDDTYASDIHNIISPYLIMYVQTTVIPLAPVLLLSFGDVNANLKDQYLHTKVIS